MPCTSPFDMWPPIPGAEDQRYVFSPQRSYAGAKAISIPCGQCTGCKMAKARDWATRINHEAKMHAQSVFLTPTYDNEHLPVDGSISRRAHQLFTKRLRNHFGELRYFGVGEYGGATGRPHYHTIVFGIDFDDKKKWRESVTGEPMFRSETLQRIWPFGDCLIGQVNPKSAGYVARYALKKLTAEQLEEGYIRLHPVTGVPWKVMPEFAVMSRRPGIGTGWYEKFSRDAFPSDFIVVDGIKRPVPSYYFDKLKQHDPALAEWIKSRRQRQAETEQQRANNTEGRLLTRHRFNRIKADRLQRSLEG